MEQYYPAEALERLLGDPCDPRRAFSFCNVVALDEAAAYPAEYCALLDRWGMGEYYIPVAAGGRLQLETLFGLVRVVARRDLTTIIAHMKSFLGAVPVWVGGTPHQVAAVAAAIRRGEQVALAYHERAHGSDMDATETEAIPLAAGGFALSGEKWLVNNATRASLLTVCARTGEGAARANLSLLLVAKAELSPSSYRHLPRLKTHGARGADFSGIAFYSAPLPARALIGEPGAATRLSLAAFQLTRALLPALSLGAADTALRATLAFAQERRLYGTTVLALPLARRALVDAFVDLLICDCTATAAVRAAHAAPDRLRLWSAVAKYFVPTTVEQVIERLAVVLGARYYLREGHYEGIFQKLVRDSALVGVFHAGSFLNLITVQVQRLYDSRRRAQPLALGELEARLQQIFCLDAALPTLDLSGLVLLGRGDDDLIAGLALLEQELARPAIAAELDPALHSALRRGLEGLRLAQGELEAEQARLEAGARGRLGQAPESFTLAERYCLLHSGAAALQLWWANRGGEDEFLAAGAWLALGLERVLARLRPGQAEPCPPAAREQWREALLAELCARLHDGRLFALAPLRLGSDEQRFDGVSERRAGAKRGDEADAGTVSIG